MSSLTSRDVYLQLLRELAPLRHVFLLGGFAEDALLDHEITRDRADLDLLVEPGSWQALVAELEGAGITRFETLFDGADGPAAFASNNRGLRIEAWLASQQTGGYALLLPGEANTFFQVRLPADTFGFPRTILAGISVQTASPLALCLLRATSARTRGDQQKRAGDLKLLEQLAQAYLPEHNPKDLIPELTQVPVT